MTREMPAASLWIFYRFSHGKCDGGAFSPVHHSSLFLSRNTGKQNLPHTERLEGHRFRVPQPPSDLDKRLAQFLKKQRGGMSYLDFSKRSGLTASSLFRLENGRQSITLTRLHGLLKRLKATVQDVFPS